MLLQLSQPAPFEAWFTASKQGKTGLAVTVDVYRNGTSILTGATATEAGGGLYVYTLAGTSTGIAGNYVAVFKTADSTVDAQHVPSLWRVGESWVQNVDASVSSRLSAGGYTAPESAGTIATAVWGAANRTLTGFGTLVADVAAATATAVWGAATRTLTAFGFAVGLTSSERTSVRAGLSTLVPADVQPNITVQAPAVNIDIAPFTSAVAALPGQVWSHASGKSVLSSAAGRWDKPTADSIRLYDADGTTVLSTITFAPAGGPYTSATPS